MKDIFQTIGDFLELYKLEIMMSVIGLILMRNLWRFVIRKQGPDVIRRKRDDEIIVKLKYRPEWFMLILSLIMLASGVFIAFVNFGTQDQRESLIFLGSCILIIIPAIREGKRFLIVKISSKGLEINHQLYKTKQLIRVELWDDLVLLENAKGSIEKIWIQFSEEHFEAVLTALNMIREYCQEQEITLEDHFDLNPKTNTTLNKAPRPSRTFKEWWEEFYKIHPREKLPD